MVRTGTGIVALDQRVIEALPPRHVGWFYGFADTLTAVVAPYSDGGLLLAVAVWLSWKRRSRAPLLAAGWAIAIVAVAVLDLKYAVGRSPTQGFVFGKGLFPSGHTACAAVLLPLVVLFTCHGRARVVGLLLSGALTVLVGVGLVWDRYHFMSDVVGSLLLAPVLLWWVLLVPAVRTAFPRPPTSRPPAP